MSRWWRWAGIGAIVAAVLVVTAAVAVVLSRPGPGKAKGTASSVAGDVASSGAALESPSPSPSPSMIAQRLGASPTPSRTPRHTTAPVIRPRPSRKPTTEKLPPPPPKPSPSPGCTPQHVGYSATRAEVKQALEAAAARDYWAGVQGRPTDTSQISVPVSLVKAIAYQESGWQSDIVACDGGIGLMQMMKPTVDFINQRFGESYDVNDYKDNAQLGANYLAWLIKYFGDVYFDGNYDLTVQDPNNPVLLDAVIAAYNVGPGNVDTADGLVIPNRTYVNNVIALMTSCECQNW